MSGLMAAYFQSNNLPKAAEMGEKVYALDPQKEMLPTLADIYLRMQNTDKYLSYAEKVIAEYPIDQSYPTALQMAQIYLKKQDVSKARALFSKVMDAYGDKLPPNVQEAAWNATRAVCYGVIASGFYAEKDYSKARELYEKVAQFDPKRDDAYYYMAMCKWNTKDQEGAIADFAKAVVLGKTNAEKAKEYMEELYKAEHSDSLDGIDEVLAQARSELGI
jgi:tetratricopeptide (TPR) repeat protein